METITIGSHFEIVCEFLVVKGVALMHHFCMYYGCDCESENKSKIYVNNVTGDLNEFMQRNKKLI